ncbi:DUF3168 domain-containing protein [Azorhizobium sp. AG788]|uniref:DUF3168 domain-containing protein n=1 Tax=Azorhizobium sp. AG788 TaxID=2183897 RepID=UPI003139642D
MSAPALVLQGAVRAAIAAAVPSVPVMDRVPGATDPMPRIVIGEGQELPNRADCMDGREIYLDIHVWSHAVGQVEAKTLTAAVVAALDDVDLTLTGHVLDLLRFDGARYLRDPDGRTSHAVLTFRALTHPDD